MNEITNPVKAIRAKCVDCMAGQLIEVKLCTSDDCSLYPFRLGTNPYRQKRKLSDEQKSKMVERLQRKQGST